MAKTTRTYAVHALVCSAGLMVAGWRASAGAQAGGAQPPATPKVETTAANSAIAPASRTDKWWMDRFNAEVERTKQGAAQGDIGLIFLGDSITQGWEGAGKDAWETFAAYKPVNYGIGGDRTQHVIYRIEHGLFDGLAKPAKGKAPGAVVLLIGTNNSNNDDNTAAEIADGIKTVVAKTRAALPQTKVLLVGILPRSGPEKQGAKIKETNELIAKSADGKDVVYVDIGAKFVQADGTLPKELMPDLLHLSPEGYKVYAEAIKGEVDKLMKGWSDQTPAKDLDGKKASDGAGERPKAPTEAKPAKP